MAIERVAIIGRGAVGLLYGSLIAKHLGDSALTFVMDDERYARHTGESITINGEPCVIPTISERDATPVDLVIFATKYVGFNRALTTAGKLAGPKTAFISLLNGVVSEQQIAEKFGWERTVLAVAQGMDAVFIKNNLTFSHPGEIRFGASSQTDPSVVSDIADLFKRSGIAHVVEDDIQHRMWVKLMLNVGINQTCMAFGGTYGSATEPASEQNRCFIAAMREAKAVACAEGVAVTEDDLTQMAQLIASLEPNGMPSMAQDRINKKPTEVELFAGTVLRLAKRHHIYVPTNQWLYDRIRQIETAYLQS